MSYLELDGDRHKIPPGEAVIGSDASSFLVLEGTGMAARHVVLVVSPDGQVSARRVVEDAQIFINGVQLGPQPAPLLHGDKIEVAGRELTFVDERRSGSTQFVSADDIAKLQQLGSKPAAKRKATAGTGGRLVSLTDGREYNIEGPSLVFGREAICDVVVPQKRVSRRHAEILATPKGYVITDMSSNGTFVNGDRISGQRLLSRADVVRVGDHEFRFYADAAAEPEEAAPEPQKPAAAGAEYRLGDTLHGILGASQPQAAHPAPPAQTAPPAKAAPPAQTAPPVKAAPPAADRPPAPPAQGAPPAAPRPPAAPPAQEAPPAAARPPAAPPVQAPPKPAQPQSAPPAEAPPAEAPPAAGGTLANLIVRKGQLKGHRFPIRVPIVNVGRAEYNDIVVPDPSVSSAHAKIQLREGIWILVDLDSTNGTFVDGDQVSGEAPIAPGALIRFGEVSLAFESTKDDSAQQGGGTQVLGAIDPPEGLA